MADPLSYTSIASALDPARQRIYQQNPYLIMAQSLGQVQPLKNEYTGQVYSNPFIQGASSLAQALSGGYGIAQARSQEADLFRQAVQGIAESVNDPNALVRMSQNPDLGPLAVALQFQQSQEKKDTTNAIRDAILKSPMVVNRLARSAIGGGQTTIPGMPQVTMPGDPAVPIGAPVGPAGAPATPTGTAMPGVEMPAAAPSFQQRLNARVEELVNNGYDFGQASEQARFELGPEQEATQKQLEELKSIRDKGNQLKQVGDTVLSVYDKAGSTGPTIISDVAGYGSAVSGAFGVEDAQQRTAARRILDSVRADVVANARVAGTGATSNYEAQMYTGAGPSSDQPPEVNKLLGELYRERGQLQKDYADFKDEYYKRRGTLVGSDQEWQKYLGDFQLVTTDQNGQPMVNKNREDWRTAIFGGSGPQAPSAPTPPSAPNAPSAPTAPSSGQVSSSDPFMQTLITAESGGNPNAVSSAGAEGATQLMPKTGQFYHDKLGIKEPYNAKDPKQAIPISREFIDTELKKFGDPRLIAAGYNAGQPALVAAIKKAGSMNWEAVKPNLPLETQVYAEKFAHLVDKNGQSPAPVAAGSATTGKAAAPTTGEKLVDAARLVGQGATAGFADEAEAWLRSQIFGTDYETELATERAKLAKLEKEHPTLAFFMETAGALPSAMLLPIGKGSIAGKIGKAAAGGGLLGGLTGAGRGTDTASRVDQAVTGAGLGAVAGGTLSAGGQLATAGANLVKEPLAKAAANIAAKLADESGTVGSVAKVAKAAKPTKADIALLKTSQGGAMKTADIEAAAKALAESEGIGGQLLLPEAFDTPGVNAGMMRQAQLLANSPETTAIAKKFVDLRKAEAPDRVLDIFNAADQSVLAGNKSITEAAQALLDAQTTARREATAPLFEAAINDKPTLQSAKLDKLLENKTIQKAIAKVKAGVETEDLPDNSTRVLQDTVAQLGGEIQKLRSKTTPGNPADIRRLTKTKTALEDEIERLNPALKEARNAFEKESAGLNELNKSQVKALAALGEKDPVRAADDVFGLEPEEISKLRETFEKSGQLGAWNDMVKSYVKDAVERGADGRDVLARLTQSRSARARLRAAVGSDIYKELEPLLSLERKYVEGARQYFAGSPTAPLLEQKNWMVKAFDLLSSPVTSAAKVVKRAFIAPEDEQLSRRMAEILFTPSEGRAWAERIAPFAKRVDTANETIRAAQSLGRAITRPSVPTATRQK